MSNRRALAPIAGAAIVTGAVLAYRKAVRTTVKTPAGEVSIIDPDDNVRVHRSGAVGSVQEAEILVERDFLERIWNADSLELLARGYWAFLRRMSLGIIRMHYSHDARTVTAFSLLPLLRFGTPRYETDEGEGRVTWPIDRGLLVAREGSRRGPPARLGEALRPRWHRRRDRRHQGRGADDRPRRGQQLLSGIRGRGRFARLGAWFYAQTQLRVHVIVCNAYLLSLPELDFPHIDMTSMPSERQADAQLEEAAR